MAQQILNDPEEPKRKLTSICLTTKLKLEKFILALTIALIASIWLSVILQFKESTFSVTCSGEVAPAIILNK